MKKRISVLSVIMTVVIILSFSAPAAALDFDKFEAREVTTYLYKMDKTTTLTLLFNRDLPEVPYINILDYLGITKTHEFNYKRNGDGTYTISHEYASMTVDTANDTAVIENSSDFVFSYNYQSEDSLFYGDDFVWVNYQICEGQDRLVLDFGKYGIDIIDFDGKVYFPVSVLNDIMVLTYIAAEYVDGRLYFTETFDDPDGYFDRSSVYTVQERSQAFAEFSYNELCFQFDCFYGCPSGAPIAATVEELGFDKALDTYSDETRLAKELLKSTSNVDFHLGLLILSKPFFDGGHTIMALGALSEMPWESELGKFMDENLENNTEEKWRAANNAMTYCETYWDYTRNLKAAKKNGTAKYEKALEWDDTAYLIICGDTAVFSFDMFVYDVLEPFLLSLEYAKEQGVKNFVIDVSTNGGGVNTIIAYLIAMITNKNTHNATATEYQKYQNTGVVEAVKYRVDVNLDKKYDRLDGELIYDFDFAVLTSKESFSSANQFAAFAKECGIMMIGETSGGGCCFVTKFYTPACELISASMYVKIIYKTGEDVDNGAEVDVDLRKPYTGEFDAEKYGTDNPADMNFYDYSDFYDFENLGRLIDEFYDKGDLDGDGNKTNKDLIKLFRYVSENIEYIAGYDINSNGKINNKDVLALFRIINKV